MLPHPSIQYFCCLGRVCSGDRHFTKNRLSDRKLQFLEGKICRTKSWKMYLGYVALFSYIWQCLSVQGETETTLSLTEVVRAKFPNKMQMARPLSVMFIASCLARLWFKTLYMLFPCQPQKKTCWLQIGFNRKTPANMQNSLTQWSTDGRWITESAARSSSAAFAYSIHSACSSCCVSECTSCILHQFSVCEALCHVCGVVFFLRNCSR